MVQVLRAAGRVDLVVNQDEEKLPGFKIGFSPSVHESKEALVIGVWHLNDSGGDGGRPS
jgi:hypothetical protein